MCSPNGPLLPPGVGGILGISNPAHPSEPSRLRLCNRDGIFRAAYRPLLCDERLVFLSTRTAGLFEDPRAFPEYDLVILLG